MENKQLLVIIIAIAMMRVLPHPANFTPIAALALWGGRYLNKKQALWVPIFIMVISDMFIGWDSIPMRIAVYSSLILAGILGINLKKSKGILPVARSVFAGSVLFFLITNAAVWAFTDMYSRNLQGLINCYTMAIPFFRNTLLGDAIYSTVLFGGLRLVKMMQNEKVLDNNLRGNINCISVWTGSRETNKQQD